ncbi:MAG: TetR/AcrR family transcriptional regulator [Firmicutes bacterium]|nr:TetR/AcrR family transcriptional regulator [Bacillota bacterium]
MGEKTDLRIIKSKTAIRRAFLELMREKGYSAVTVSDIAKRAMINRKTFYFHYETKDDLYNEILNDTLDIFISSHIIKNLRGGDEEYQNSVITELLKNILKVKQECLLFMSDDTDGTFNARLKETLSNALIYEDEVLERTENDLPLFRLLVDVYFNTFMRVLRWWLESGDEDTERFTDTVRMLFSNKPLEMLGLK